MWDLAVAAEISLAHHCVSGQLDEELVVVFEFIRIFHHSDPPDILNRGFITVHWIPKSQISDACLLEYRVTCVVQSFKAISLLGGRARPARPYSWQTLKQNLDLQQVRVALVKPFNELVGAFGTFVVFQDTKGQQNKQRKQERHVNVGNPVPVIEQGTPDSPQGRSLQNPCFDHGLCRRNGVTLRRCGHRDSGCRPVWPGDRIPREIMRQIRAKQVGARPAGLAADTVAVSHQGTDFKQREAIEIGANVGQLALDFRVQGRRILTWLYHLGNRDEDELGRVLKGFVFELPDPVHQDAARAHGGSDQPAGAPAGPHLDPLADIADDDTVQRTVEPAKAGTVRGFAERRLEQVPVQPELIAQVKCPPFYTGGLEKCRRLGVHELQASEDWLMIKLVAAHDILQTGQHELLLGACTGSQ